RGVGGVVALGTVGVPRGFVGDRVVVIGRDRAAHAAGTEDRPGVDDRHGAAAKDELVVTERGDVRRKELASLVEALLELERRRPEGGGGVGLRPGDLGGGPERAVHALARDEVTRVVTDGDGDLEAEGLRIGSDTLDVLGGWLKR